MRDSVRKLGGNLVLGRYRIVRELARGGMGMVYLGRIEGAAGFAKPVVIKRVLSHIDETAGSRAQFAREARLLSELQHPNIVGVIDFGQEDGSYLMVLEYVHGFHVGQWLKFARSTRGDLEWDYAVFVVSRVLDALHYAHTRKAADGSIRPIVHRDVSPGNVLIDLQGNVRLLDFGIARTADDGEEAKTQDGIVKGKLPYIAPEMYQSKDASVASDVYAAGVMLYQLLAGRNPFAAKDMGAIVTKVLSHTPLPISHVRPDVPPQLDGVLMRAMAKNPADRYPSASSFGRALAAQLGQPEARVADEMRAAVTVDFTDRMAAALSVASLTELDAAWRASSRDPGSEQPLERSSFPPLDDDMATAVISAERLDSLTSSTRGDAADDLATVQVSAGGHEAATRVVLLSPDGTIPTTTTQGASEKHGGAPAGPTLPAAATQVASSNRTIILSTLAAGLLAGGIAAAVLLLGKDDRPAPRGQRYLLVERPGTDPKPAQDLAPAQKPATKTTEGSPKENETVAGQDTALADKRPAPPSTPPPSSAAPASESVRLTNAFAKRQGAVQSCFSQQAGSVEGAPRVSVRFSLGPDGQVDSATLSPSAVATTALGQCLLRTARATQFPALGKSVAFSIPITAQVIR